MRTHQPPRLKGKREYPRGKKGNEKTRSNGGIRKSSVAGNVPHKGSETKSFKKVENIETKKLKQAGEHNYIKREDKRAESVIGIARGRLKTRGSKGARTPVFGEKSKQSAPRPRREVSVFTIAHICC